MFANIGSKIKGLATIFCWIGIIASVIAGISFIGIGMSEEEGIFTLLGLGIAAVGSLLSWIGSFLLYGFGQLVENSDVRTELLVRESMKKEEPRSGANS